MNLDSLLDLTYVALLLGTGIILTSYRPDEQTRYRARVSICAAAFAGTCFAMAMWTVTNWGSSCLLPRALQTLFVACVFAAVASTGGNLAKLLPRLKWTHHL